MGLSPPRQSCKPPNGNMKHDKSVEFLSIFRMSSPPPRTNTKYPYLKLSRNGSETADYYSSFVHKNPNLTQMK